MLTPATARAGALLLFASTTSGCGFEASQEWSLKNPDEEPRVTRIHVTNAIVERGLIVGGTMTVAERRAGTEARSGGAAVGYGWGDLLGDTCWTGFCWLGMNLIGIAELGRPPIVWSEEILGGFGGRGEIALSLRSNPEQEVELITVRPEIVGAVDMRLWTAEGYRMLEVTMGLGLRISIVSEGGPPILRWLKALL